jgi:hypothetical protein
MLCSDKQFSISDGRAAFIIPKKYYDKTVRLLSDIIAGG